MSSSVDIIAIPGVAAPLPTRRGRVNARRMVRARYDAAQTTDENRAHWANADSLSANAANNPAVRQTLRNRSRYEAANSGYADGIGETLANYVIGTGPRLQMLIPGAPDLNRLIEQRFHRWARRTRLAMKLWVMRLAAAVDGESFGVFSTNPRLRDRCQLDLKLIECDRVSNPLAMLDPRLADGVIFDDFDNPLAYQILRQHPGDTFFSSLPGEFDTIRAEDVLHLFKRKRPEQMRGVPEMTPTLALFANLRRYTLAVLAAAETAADLAGVIKTQSAPLNDEDDADIAGVSFESVEIPRRSLMVLPDGHEIQQLKAEQPTTTYADFKGEILSEAGRPFNMPFNIAAAKSAGYNFASAKLDFATFDKSIGIDQFRVEEEALEPTLEKWFQEARLIPGYLPDGIDFADGLPAHEWFWDGLTLLDPREASARETAIRAGFASRAGYYGREGKDVDEQDATAAKAHNMTVEEYRRRINDYLWPPAGVKAPAAATEPEDEEGDDEEE